MDSPSEFERSEVEPSETEGSPVDHQRNRLPDPGRPRVVFTGRPDEQNEFPSPEQDSFSGPGNVCSSQILSCQ